VISSAPRRIAALSLLFGSFLLLLMLFSLPMAMAYEMDEKLHKVAGDPAPIDGVTTTGGATTAELPLDTAVPTGQTELANAQTLLNQAGNSNPNPAALAAQAGQQGTQQGNQRLPGDGSSYFASNLAPFNPEENQVIAVQAAEGDTGDQDGGKDDTGGGQAPVAPASIRPEELPGMALEVEQRQRDLAEKYTTVTQAHEQALGQVEEAQSHPSAAGALPAAVAEAKQDQATAIIWHNEAWTQNVQLEANKALQEAHVEGGNTAARLEDMKRRRAEMGWDLSLADAAADDSRFIALSQKLTQLDPTVEGSAAHTLQHNYNIVIPQTIHNLEGLLGAAEEAETAAAKVLRRDAERDRAGVGQDQNRWNTSLMANARVQEWIDALGEDLPADPGVYLPTAQAIARTGQVPGWNTFNVSLEGDLNPLRFPGNGRPDPVYGAPTWNFAHGGFEEQRVTVQLPTGAGLLIAAPTFTNTKGVGQVVGDDVRVVRASADSPATIWETVKYNPVSAPPGTAARGSGPLFPVPAPPPAGEMPQFVEGYLVDELKPIDASYQQNAAQTAQVNQELGALKAALAQLRSRMPDQQGRAASSIADLEARISAHETDLGVLDWQRYAQEMQAYSIHAENAARQTGGRLDRKITMLREQEAWYTSQGASDAQFSGYRDPTGPLQTAWKDYTETVPKAIEQAQQLRAAYAAVEAASDGLTAEVIAEAMSPAPPVPGEGSPTYQPDQQAVAFARHAEAVAHYQRYADAITRARALEQQAAAMWQILEQERATTP
jgi:hypothetical protein